MKRAYVGLILVAIGAIAATLLLQRWTTRDDHRHVRQLIVHLTLARVDDPVIVLGDSIVEASVLPGNVCGHAVVNAGLNGASTASDLGNWLAPALAGKQAAAIIVALGINDALTSAPISQQTFEDRYQALLGRLSKLTTRVLVLAIPMVETRGRMLADMQKEANASIDGFNAVLPGLAARNNATFLPLSDMPASHTIDGVHLNAAGYQIWDKAILAGAASLCGR